MMELVVWLDQAVVGHLAHDAQANQFKFTYIDAWKSRRDSFPVSPLLPLEKPEGETAETHSALVRQFFENLLPEGDALDHAAQAAGTAKSNLVGLLIAMGRETAGALRVTTSAQQAEASNEGGEEQKELTLVTPEELSERIRKRPEIPFSVWDGQVRLSIAGYQDKIAVYERDGQWYLADGPRLASTMIVKPLPTRPQLASLPDNEYMCMQLARRVGLRVADAQLVRVPEPVLFVRRFDRVEADGRVHRLHIIDGCQALGMAVSMKYERAYGDAAEVANIREGVSLPKLFGLLNQSPQPAADKRALLHWVVFQVLIGNTDAHGKNVSFFWGTEGLRLAPAYDLVCMSALDAGLTTQYAMAIGDAFNAQDLSPFEWAHLAHLCDLPFRLVANELRATAQRAMDAIPGVAAEVVHAGVAQAVAHRIQTEVLANCARQLELAAQVGRFKRSDFH
jgi:serine/threonine-protein kinase HipA